MIVSTKEIKEHMPIDLPDGDVLIGCHLYGMVKGYKKITEEKIKKKIEKKILNAYKYTHKYVSKVIKMQKINEIKKMMEKYPNMAVLTPEEIEKEFGVKISSGLIIANKKVID